MLIYYIIYWSTKKGSTLQSLPAGGHHSIDAQASSQLAVQKYRVTSYQWTAKDYLITTLVAGLMAIGGTVAIVFCSGIVPSTPRSIGLLLLGLVVVCWAGLWAIASFMIEALSSVSSLKSSTVSSRETRFLQITSDATVTVASPMAIALIALGLTLGVACATVAALYYVSGGSMCGFALLAYLAIFVIYYSLYWVITLAPWKLQQLINHAIGNSHFKIS